MVIIHVKRFNTLKAFNIEYYVSKEKEKYHRFKLQALHIVYFYIVHDNYLKILLDIKNLILQYINTYKHKLSFEFFNDVNLLKSFILF